MNICSCGTNIPTSARFCQNCAGADRASADRASSSSARGIGGGLGAFSAASGDVPLSLSVRNTFIEVNERASSASGANQLRRNSTDGGAPHDITQRPSQLRRVNAEGDAVPGSQDSELARQTERLSLADPAGSPASQSNRLYCPVATCPAHDQHRHSGWMSIAGLRAHVDGHMLGMIPGAIPSDWLTQNRLQPCRQCGKTVSVSVGNGMHRRCAARAMSAQAGQSHPPGRSQTDARAPDLNLLEELPSLHDICSWESSIREHLEPELLAIAEKEFLRCIDNAIRFSEDRAWDFIGTDRDTENHKRTRVAWSELWMFCKTCLPQLPGGKAKSNRNRNIILNKLERWRSGERRSLWDELPKRRRDTKDAISENHLLKHKQETCIAYAKQGMPGKAISRLTGAALVSGSDDVVEKMASKFPRRPANQLQSVRPMAPEANELSDECVAKCILSFKRGLGAGPSGARPDFVRQIVGDKADRPGLCVIARFANHLANGLAPRAMRPYLGGANGFALHKDRKISQAEEAEAAANGAAFPHNDTDIRPVCCGEVWRRIVGKALLSTETQNLSDHLYPNQLAVAVSSGSECMAHLARQWMSRHRDDVDRVLVDFDETNAHNTVDRHVFLQRAHQIVPSMCRWMEFIYPTGEPTYIFFHGSAIESVAGGQQGCPLMMMAHALVQRIVLESLSVVEVDPRTVELAPVLDPKPVLDLAPGFADDGFFAGPSAEVQRCVAHVKTFMPSLGLRFSRLEAIPSAGDRSLVDRTVFTSLGCTFNSSANVSIMKSPVGDTQFCEQEVGNRVDKALKIIRAIADLPDAHCALYLLRYQVGRMEYTARTTPLESCRDALCRFDRGTRLAYGNIVGKHPSDDAWAQVSLPVRQGGLGLRSISHIAPAAYYSSRAATWQRCEAIYSSYSMDVGDPVRNAEQILLNRSGDNLNIPQLPCDEVAPTQQTISWQLATWCFDQLCLRAGPFDRTRLGALRAPMVGRWLSATPLSDMHYTAAELSTVCALHLGQDVFHGQSSCRFCNAVLDAKGIHAASCTAGGDMILRHNRVRDLIYSFCCRAALNAEVEKGGLLDEPGIFLDLSRPADVLVDGIGSGSRPQERVALDIKVINALGQGHYNDTQEGPLVAAERYRVAACSRARIFDRCAERGIRYEPLVFTTQGAMEKHSEAILSQITDTISRSEGREPGQIKSELLQAVSFSIAQSVAKAVMRRQPRYRYQVPATEELDVLTEPMDDVPLDTGIT